MLWYHFIAPSSDIYPTNQPTRVNMQHETTMIWFDLLNHIKELEPMKNTIETFNIIITTLTNHLNLFANQPLGPNEILDHLTSRCSHAIGLPTSMRLWILLWKIMLASRD